MITFKVYKYSRDTLFSNGELAPMVAVRNSRISWISQSFCLWILTSSLNRAIPVILKSWCRLRIWGRSIMINRTINRCNRISIKLARPSWVSCWARRRHICRAPRLLTRVRARLAWPGKWHSAQEVESPDLLGLLDRHLALQCSQASTATIKD